MKYFAIFLDDYLKYKNLFSFKELGRAYLAVIVESDVTPSRCSRVEITKEEALSWRFVDVPNHVLQVTVRPDTDSYEQLKDRRLERVPQVVNKITGEIDEAVIKYKYTITPEDRVHAASLREKIDCYVPYNDYHKD